LSKNLLNKFYTQFVFPTFLLALFCLLFLTGCNRNPEAVTNEKEYVPEVTVTEVSSGLQQEFTVTGDIEAHQVSPITSEIRGKVDSVLVNQGDTVSKSTTLLKLSSSEVSSAYSTASTTLKNAQVSLKSTQLTSKQNVQAAQIALETAQTNLQSTLKQNAALKKQAEETLASAKLSVNLGVTAAETSLDNKIKSVLPTVQTAVTAADKILGVSESFKYANDTFENNLGALDKIGKSEAEKTLRNLLTEVALYSPSYANAAKLLDDTEAMLQKTLEVLNSSITGSAYSETSLNTDKNTITAQTTLIRTSASALETASDALDTARQDSNGSSQAILNAQAAYDTTIAQLTATEEASRKALKSAQNALETAKQSAQLSQITAKSSVDTAFGSYDQARISQDKLVIKAPFAGKVSSINIKTGEEINPGTHLITVEDDSILKLIAYLSQTDVEKVSVGDEIRINQNGETAQITSISPSADPITKKYKVEILHSSSTLKPGEVIRITFKTGEGILNHGRLFIPLPSLHIQPDDVFVWKIKDRKTVKAPVTVGEIIGDYVEILTGLSEGDEIIAGGGRLIEDEGVKVKVTNKPVPKIPN